jgi:hypothetical protein
MEYFDGFLTIADYNEAEYEPFARHGLGETARAKPPASGPPEMGWVTTRDHSHTAE